MQAELDCTTSYDAIACLDEHGQKMPHDSNLIRHVQFHHPQ
jgi:hypothetical protein